MVKIGYSLSSEELSAAELIHNARMAEETGFEFALISDHYHRGPTTNPRVLAYGLAEPKLDDRRGAKAELQTSPTGRSFRVALPVGVLEEFGRR